MKKPGFKPFSVLKVFDHGTECREVEVSSCFAIIYLVVLRMPSGISFEGERKGSLSSKICGKTFLSKILQ